MIRKRLQTLRFAWGLVCCLLATTSHAGEPEPILKVGIVPQQAASQLARDWMPILTYLSSQCDCRLLFQTAPDIPEFEHRLGLGEYDIAYMNPYHYTVYSKAQGYRAFARQRDKLIRGVIVVRKDSPIESLQEFSGKTLAFPAPAAFAASVLPRGFLSQQGIPIEARYVSSHDSVYRAVAAGLYPGGGGIERTLAAVDPATSDQLRVLWTSDGYTPHPFAAHPRVAEELVERLQRAMIGMEQDPKGRTLLETIRFKGIEAAVDTDWDDVRELAPELLDYTKEE